MRSLPFLTLYIPDDHAGHAHIVGATSDPKVVYLVAKVLADQLTDRKGLALKAMTMTEPRHVKKDDHS